MFVVSQGIKRKAGRAEPATATVDRVALLARAGMVTHSMEVVEVVDITAAVAGPVSSAALYIAYFIIDI